MKVYDETFYNHELKRALLPPRKLAIQYKIPMSDKEAYERVIEIMNNIKQFVKEGKNLLLWSKEQGTGKTLMAIKIAESYIAQRNEKCRATDCAVFINVGDLLFYRKDFSNPESQELVRKLEDKINKCRLVIWDDLGTKDLSDYDKEYLIVLLNRRLNDLAKSNIYTTNLTSNQLFEVVGARLSSRLFEDTEVIEFKGGDHR